MNAQIGLDKCLAFISSQLQPGGQVARAVRNGCHAQAVTISRQTGSGGHAVAERLAQLLQNASPHETRPWTVFDRNLVERILEDHHLPARLARFMPEDRISEIADTMDELFGLHPSSWKLVHKSAQTILHLVELGHAIILGRGAQVITQRLPHVYHVRLVGSVERRLAHIQEIENVDAQTARRLLETEDRGRERYLKKYFGRDIEDPLLYHLVINTDLVSYDLAARLISDVGLGLPAEPPSHNRSLYPASPAP